MAICTSLWVIACPGVSTRPYHAARSAKNASASADTTASYMAGVPVPGIGVSICPMPKCVSDRSRRAELSGNVRRASAAVVSAPATRRISQDWEPGASIGASARVRPWVPSAPVGRRSTISTPPGSTTSVSDGTMAPLANASGRASFIATGSVTPFGHVVAPISACAGRRKPAASCMPGARFSGACSTVPAACTTLPLSSSTAAPSTMPAGSVRPCASGIAEGSSVPAGKVRLATGRS